MGEMPITAHRARPQVGTDGGADRAGDHQRGHQRGTLAQHADAVDRPDEGVGADLVGHAADLHGGDHAERDGDQDRREQRDPGHEPALDQKLRPREPSRDDVGEAPLDGLDGELHELSRRDDTGLEAARHVVDDRTAASHDGAHPATAVGMSNAEFSRSAAAPRTLS
jgi:hypothetical protein